MEYLVVEGCGTEDLVEVVTIGIGNEYLSEVITGYQTDNLLHALGIELIEDVVEQQQGRRLRARPL